MTNISRKQGLTVTTLVWFAGLLLYFMLSGFTQPFNGVEMRAYVKSNEQLNEYAQVDGRDWLIDVVDGPNYIEGKSKTVTYIRPGTKVGIIGVSHNMSKIRVGKIEGWVPSVFLVTDPKDFPAEEDRQEAIDDSFSYDDKGE